MKKLLLKFSTIPGLPIFFSLKIYFVHIFVAFRKSIKIVKTFYHTIALISYVVVQHPACAVQFKFLIALLYIVLPFTLLLLKMVSF